MDSNDQNNINAKLQEQKAPPICHTIADLLHPEEHKDGESPIAFGGWQVDGIF